MLSWRSILNKKKIASWTGWGFPTTYVLCGSSSRIKHRRDRTSLTKDSRRRTQFKLHFISETCLGSNLLTITLDWLSKTESVTWRHHSGPAFWKASNTKTMLREGQLPSLLTEEGKWIRWTLLRDCSCSEQIELDVDQHGPSHHLPQCPLSKWLLHEL